MPKYSMDQQIIFKSKRNPSSEQSAKIVEITRKDTQEWTYAVEQYGKSILQKLQEDQITYYFSEKMWHATKYAAIEEIDAPKYKNGKSVSEFRVRTV